MAVNRPSYGFPAESPCVPESVPAARCRGLKALVLGLLATLLALVLMPAAAQPAYGADAYADAIEAPETGVHIGESTAATTWKTTWSSGGVTAWGFIHYEPAAEGGRATITLDNVVYESSATALSADLLDTPIDIRLIGESKLTSTSEGMGTSSALRLASPNVTITGPGTLELAAEGEALFIVDPTTVPAPASADAPRATAFAGLTLKNCVVKVSSGYANRFAVRCGEWNVNIPEENTGHSVVNQNYANPAYAKPLTLDGASLQVTGNNRGVYAELSTDSAGHSFAALNAVMPELDTPTGLTGALIVGDTGRIYGSGSAPVAAPSQDVTIPAGMALTVQSDAKLAMAAGKELEVQGSLAVERGATVEGSGLSVGASGSPSSSVSVEAGGTLALSDEGLSFIYRGATLANAGTATLAGGLINCGTLRNEQGGTLTVDAFFNNGTESAGGTVVNYGEMKLNGDNDNYGTIENHHWLDFNGIMRNHGTITDYGEGVVSSTAFEGNPVQMEVPDPCDGLTITVDLAPTRFITKGADGGQGSILVTPPEDGGPLTIELENAVVNAGTEAALMIASDDAPVRIVLKGENRLEGRRGMNIGAAQVTIEGPGSLEVRGTRAIVVRDPSGAEGLAQLTLSGGTVRAEGVFGIQAPSVALEGGTLVARGTKIEGVNVPDEVVPTGIVAQKLTGAGNAFVVASSVAAPGEDDELAELPLDDFTSGVLIVGDEGTLHGDHVTLSADAAVPEGATLEIPAGTTLTVPEGVTLTNDGLINLYGTLDVQGRLANNGTIHVFKGAELTALDGTLEDNGEILWDEKPAENPDGEAGSEGDAGKDDADKEGAAGATDKKDGKTDGKKDDLSQTGDRAAAVGVALTVAALAAGALCLRSRRAQHLR